LITDGSGVLSWSTAASGDVYGPASATDNAVARYDGTTGKIIQNSAVTIADDGATVIAVNSASDGLRITQIGAGNALVVEDSANPDASPTVITASGQVVIGSTTALTYGGFSGSLQINSASQTSLQLSGWQTTSSAPPQFVFARSASGTVGTNGAVVSGSDLGAIRFLGDDGATFIPAATILAEVDGTPGTNDMPGRLVFSTTADGDSTTTERVRISSSGGLGIGGSPTADVPLLVAQVGTAINMNGVRNTQVTPATATASHKLFQTVASTVASAFTLPNLTHYEAFQSTIGAGSTVTSQYGFFAQNNLTGATNNYGFYGAIASGTGRYNFYATGTADNYFAGSVGIGSVPIAGTNFYLSKNITGAVSSFSMGNFGQIQSDVTTEARYFSTAPSTAAAAFTLADLRHYVAFQGTFGAGSAVTNQVAFYAGANLTGATNNYGFYGNIASGTGRFNFYAAGTADNYFAGNVGIGTSSPILGLTIKNDTGSTTYGQRAGSLVLESNNVTSGGGTDVVWSTGTQTNQRYASIGSAIVGNDGASGSRGDIAFATKAASATTTLTERMRIDRTGTISLGAAPGSESLRVTPIASAVNYLNAVGGATGNQTYLAAQGSDTNILFGLYSKGNAGFNFYTNAGAQQQFAIAHTASAVNYITAFGNTAGNGGYFQAAGSDTNISMLFSAKGTGGHVFYTAGNSFTPQFAVTHTASAVNYLSVTGAVTGGIPFILAQGSDTDISARYGTKGNGFHAFFTNSTGSNTQFLISNTASAVNYLQVTGAATGGGPTISAQGSDANINFELSAKGTGLFRHTSSTGVDSVIRAERTGATASVIDLIASNGTTTLRSGGAYSILFSTNAGTTQFVVAHTASAVNYLQVTGSASTTPTLSAQGSGADLDILLTPKGTGNVRFGTYTAGVIAQAGSITIKDAAGTTRRLLVG
jgi:hypothetical protein